MRLCLTVINMYEKLCSTCASTQHVGLPESFYPCLYLLMKPVDLQFGCISEAVQYVVLALVSKWLPYKVASKVSATVELGGFVKSSCYAISVATTSVSSEERRKACGRCPKAT